MRLHDQMLVELVRAHIQGDTRLAGQCIDVSSSEGEIVLMGCADTEEQKELACEMAKGVSGVKQVRNRISTRCKVEM